MEEEEKDKHELLRGMSEAIDAVMGNYRGFRNDYSQLTKTAMKMDSQPTPTSTHGSATAGMAGHASTSVAAAPTMPAMHLTMGMG
jgi:hypothetical protein